MKRRILLAVSALLMVTALALPTTGVCAFGFCESCDNQCYQEGVSAYYQCRAGGGSIATCDSYEKLYYANCTSIFCPGCPTNHHNQ